MANGVPNNKSEVVKIDVLIGNDYYEDIIKSERIQLEDGLYMVNSTLGWIFSRRLSTKGDNSEISMLVQDKEGEKTGKEFWDLETVGIKVISEEVQNNKFKRDFQRSLIKENNRYQVSWPWRVSRYELSKNYKLSEARLKSLVHQLGNDKLSLLKYDEIIKKQEIDGIIEKAYNSKEYLQRVSTVVHYLPHHMVVNKNEPNHKIRIVYEGCAKDHPPKEFK